MQASSRPNEILLPWNKGIIMGQKPPLKRSEVWAIRIRLQIAKRAILSNGLVGALWSE